MGKTQVIYFFAKSPDDPSQSLKTNRCFSDKALRLLCIAGNYESIKGDLDIDAVQPVTVEFTKGRTYWSLTLGTIWWAILNGTHKLTNLAVPGENECVPQSLTPVLQGYIAF